MATPTFQKRMKNDASIALCGHWPKPVAAVFLLLFCFSLFFMVPETVLTLGTLLLPAALHPYLGSMTAGVCLMLGLFLLLALSPSFFSLENFYDRIVTGRGQQDPPAYNRSSVAKARMLKSRLALRRSLVAVGAFFAVTVLVTLANFFFEPTAVLSALPKDIPLPDALRALGSNPMAGAFCLLATPVAFLFFYYLYFAVTMPYWMASVLLQEGAPTVESALMQSRHILAPHKSLQRSLLRSFYLPLLSCLLILPMFWVLPKFWACKAIFCRYCLSPQGLSSAGDEVF